MIPAPFDYVKAHNVSEAIALLDKHGYDAKVLAGGQSLLPAMKLRLNRPAVVVDISGIEGLNDIAEEGDRINVGANCTHQQICDSKIIKEHLNILSQTASVIGDLQVRNRGTIGGSLAHADPAADYPATVLATDAIIHVQGRDGSRTIEASDFFEGIYTTNLQDSEIITHISFPKVDQGVYVKFFQSASRFAVVGCAVVRGSGKIKIGLTGVSDMPYRAKEAEDAYDGTDSCAALAANGVDVLGHHFASAEYRTHLTKVYVRRALAALG